MNQLFYGSFLSGDHLDGAKFFDLRVWNVYDTAAIAVADNFISRF